MRTGIGVDVHPLAEGRRLVLGGVEVPYRLGLDGHSDGDVLAHAVIDAMLGAAGLGDIGDHFPPGDPRYKGIESLELVARTVAILAARRWRATYVDATIVAQRPQAQTPPQEDEREARLGARGVLRGCKRQGHDHRRAGIRRPVRGNRRPRRGHRRKDSMRLYNTLSGTREEFATADGKVRMYVCGITPYSASHLGHAMSSVAFDVVRRYLEFQGFEVLHVQNFTDVDDKMIQAAAENGTSMSELAEANIEAYLDEMDALGVLRAHNYPRATGEIDKIIEMIQGLEGKGYAYAVGGDVYFRVSSDADYGKLSRRSLDSLMAGARVEIDESKENEMDFALWKAQKPGENRTGTAPGDPADPDGTSSAAPCRSRILANGSTSTAAAQGPGLPAPTRTRSRNQSPSPSASHLPGFWLHNGLLRLGEDKMSKSQGNIISIREALGSYSGDALRLFHPQFRTTAALWCTNDGAVAAQERALKRLRNAIALEGGVAANGSAVDAARFRERFVEAMDDDLKHAQGACRPVRPGEVYQPRPRGERGHIGRAVRAARARGSPRPDDERPGTRRGRGCRAVRRVAVRGALLASGGQAVRSRGPDPRRSRRAGSDSRRQAAGHHLARRPTVAGTHVKIPR